MNCQPGTLTSYSQVTAFTIISSILLQTITICELSMQRQYERKNTKFIFDVPSVRYKPPFVIYVQLDKALRCEQDASRNEKKINFAVRSATVLPRLPIDPRRLGIN